MMENHRHCVVPVATGNLVGYTKCPVIQHHMFTCPAGQDTEVLQWPGYCKKRPYGFVALWSCIN